MAEIPKAAGLSRRRAAAVPFLAHSFVVYGAMVAPYAYVERLNIAWLAFPDAIGEAMCGNLISPAGRLFVYVPLFVLSVFRFWISRPFKQPRGGSRCRSAWLC